MVKNYAYIEEYAKPGDKLWACNGLTAVVRPYRCVVCIDKRPPKNGLFSDPEKPPYSLKTLHPNWYAIPLKTNLETGLEIPDWRHAKHACNRTYADTKEECEKIYQEQIKQQIRNTQKRLEKLRAELNGEPYEPASATE